jgi:hypothetical protein
MVNKEPGIRNQKSKVKPRIFLGCFLSVLAVSRMGAQTPSWNIPSSGYLYDAPAQSIRRVVGFAGSAYLGSAAIDGLTWASVAPNQKSALLVRDGALSWIADLSAPDQFVSMDAAAPLRQALWSGDSSRAVVLTDGRELIWLAGFGSSPVREASRALDVSQDWTLLSADSSADKVLLASGTGADRQVWLASRSSATVSIPLATYPAAAVFTADGVIFLADSAGHQILRIDGLDGAPAATPVFSSDVYLSDPVGIAISVDGRRLFVADGAGKMIRVFDSRDGSLLAELPAEAEIVSLTVISHSQLLLNTAAETPGAFSFLDTGEPARMFFIPRGE